MSLCPLYLTDYMSLKKCAQIGVCVFSIKACKGAAVAPDSKLILPQKMTKVCLWQRMDIAPSGKSVNWGS